MHALKIFGKVLVTFLALSLIAGSVSAGFGAELTGLQRYGICWITFGSIVLLHVLIWKFIVVDAPILGRDPMSFIGIGRPKTFFTGLTTFGYFALALHYLRIAGFPTSIDPNVLGNADGRIYGLAFGLTLIGVGLAARLRVLFQSLQSLAK